MFDFYWFYQGLDGASHYQSSFGWEDQGNQLMDGATDHTDIATEIFWEEWDDIILRDDASGVPGAYDYDQDGDIDYTDLGHLADDYVLTLSPEDQANHQMTFVHEFGSWLDWLQGDDNLPD